MSIGADEAWGEGASLNGEAAAGEDRPFSSSEFEALVQDASIATAPTTMSFRMLPFTP
jgi:hypothetical protein